MQPFTDYLPPEIASFIRSRVAGEFATVSSLGVPIDTPTFLFPSEDLSAIDLGTGLAYPAKAERARRNPKVGLLFEGLAADPVVSIAGHAIVQDSDLQANLGRYLSETILTPNVDPRRVAWETTRKRLYYLARIIVRVVPVHVRWWGNRGATDSPPHEWQLTEGTELPTSDPLPEGAPSRRPIWPQRSWQELAVQATSSEAPAHLTLLDADGFPVPMRVTEVKRIDDGFRLIAPRGAPWRSGQATLSFLGKEVFVGSAQTDATGTIFRVERALPILPMMDDRTRMAPDVMETLSERLSQEAARRGQPLPQVPDEPPPPTAGARMRAISSEAIDVQSVGGGLSR